MVSPSYYDVTYKILVLGESNVGKTSLIHRFTDLEYQDTLVSTIGIDSCTRIIELDGERIRLQIWDTAGQERFRTLTSAYYRGAMGIMLVYDVTAEYSFGNISNWMEAIQQSATPGVCQMLVAHKVDSPKKAWMVPAERGVEKAEMLELQFVEASAKQGVGVEEAFFSMARLIQAQRREKQLTESNVIAQKAISLSSSTTDSSSKCC